MASVAQKPTKKSKFQEPIDLSPKSIPNPKALEVMESFLELTMMAFRSGIIQNAGDWGVVAAYLQNFANYVDTGSELKGMNDDFEESLLGDRYFPYLVDILTEGHTKVWEEIAPSFMALQRGNF